MAALLVELKQFNGTLNWFSRIGRVIRKPFKKAQSKACRQDLHFEDDVCKLFVHQNLMGEFVCYQNDQKITGIKGKLSCSASLYRPSIDRVVLIKLVLVQYLFGMRSMRQPIQEIETNIAYRWFLVYGFLE